jgi:dTDP-4-amino-4,6-dideoxygalactose transaminase
MNEKSLYVTEPSLPKLKDLIPLLERIWESKILTNCGPLHQELETSLEAFLDVPKVSLFANGTIALITAIQALGLQGEVITTPYSFLATTHALKWNGLTPVFVDIDPKTGNIKPELIEAAITPNTTAILGVHTYGTPCEVERIREIAEAHKLLIIYDACHSFGVQDNGGSILRHGDLSVLSFHATKVFNTFEGGAIICKEDRTKERINRLKNFGIGNQSNYAEIGLNGKMNEFQAAIGLLQLKDISEQIERRRVIGTRYEKALADIKGIELLEKPGTNNPNYAYMPIIITSRSAYTRDELYLALKSLNIHPRRYFFPLISELPAYRDLPSSEPLNLPNAFQLSRQVLCLPISSDLELKDQQRVIEAIDKLYRERKS